VNSRIVSLNVSYSYIAAETLGMVHRGQYGKLCTYFEPPPKVQVPPNEQKDK